ncbi:DUF2845 domain-containing protein [Legionella hackeliae]|uniref:DUF2845 domain-containing protein n=1 Tax=Legionella hackeliae TaxID=449 RepID=A0A0A8USM9_LEGHA|nr:DUF2845 domain-containing protein [Legionella hackeliae]KTD10281.1 hypothetical protein Lhac_2649 [Legionella hackeliae]CEK09779.1 conserved exported protein of unknown function [Legionella hackeliae]STX49689.1 Protein of uncharacterised function (DUF2845) [Legionella hackeliae]
MTTHWTLFLGIASLGFSINAFAVQSMYCPQNHGYINIGMSPDQVLNACGQPLSRQESNTPVMQKVPVLQLLYNNKGSQSAFYGVWSLPVGVNSGAQLEIDIIDNKVSAVRLNGSQTNAFSICGGSMVQVGDPVGKVYGSCGNPSLVNNTFINQPIQSNQKPEIWVYQADKFQTPFRLTFVNGKLQSID